MALAVNQQINETNPCPYKMTIEYTTLWHSDPAFQQDQFGKSIEVCENGKCIVHGVKSIAEGDFFMRMTFPHNFIITRQIKTMSAYANIPFDIDFVKLYTSHEKNRDSPFHFGCDKKIYWTAEKVLVYFNDDGLVFIKGSKSFPELDRVWKAFLEEIQPFERISTVTAS